MRCALLLVIFLPIFINLYIAIHAHNMVRFASVKNRRKKGCCSMTNELIKKYIGHICMISTGAFGQSVSGEIISIVDNWIEIKTKKGNQLLNADYITNIIPNEKT